MSTELGKVKIKVINQSTGTLVTTISNDSLEKANQFLQENVNSFSWAFPVRFEIYNEEGVLVSE